MTEKDLIAGCIDRDPKCQEELYNRFSARMYAVCLRYARHELEAQDMLQEGFIKVFEKLNTFKGSGSLEGWVRRIMVHSAISTYRKKSFQNEKFGMENLPENSVPSDAFDRMSHQELMGLIQTLPDGYRMVFNLYAIEGFDHKEIASKLGCGESTSRSQLAKARKLLQTKIVAMQRVAS
jgi:RNA polymerase sigma-70 factor (ECF subfamily)